MGSRTGSRVLRLVAVAASSCLLAVTACSGDDSNAERLDVDSSDRSAVPIDQRVLDGAAPVSGESMESRRWLRRQLFEMRLPEIKECFESNGYPQLIPVAEADFEEFNNTYSYEFPEPERLLAEGLNPDTGPSAFQGEMATPDDPEVPEETRVFNECNRNLEVTAGDAERAHDLNQALMDAWMPVVIEYVSGSEVNQEAEEEFGRCLREAGVPDEFTQSQVGSLDGQEIRLSVDDAFRDWVAQRVVAGSISATAIEDAPTYVECGRPLWEDRAMRLQIERDRFVEQYHDELSELTLLTTRD